MGRLRSELDNKIAKCRISIGLTQEQLALAANVSRQTIVALEGRTYSPSTVLALRLSFLLDASVNELFLLPDSALAEMQGQKERIAELRQRQH